MEWRERGTHRTCVDPAVEILEKFVVESYSLPSHFKNDIRNVLLEFRFLKMLFWGLDHWQASEGYDSRFRSVSTTCALQLMLMAEDFEGYSLFRGAKTNLEPRIHYFRKRIKPFKQQVKEICILLLHDEIRCKPCQPDLELFLEYVRETASFIEFLRDNLQALNSKFHLIAPVRQQIQFITGKLKVFGNFANPVSHSITRVKNLGELVCQTRTWANHLSRLACLYWIDHGMDETLASTMGTMLSDLMHKTMPYTPGVIASYFEDTLIPQLLARYFDFLLEELVTPPAVDDIETLREGLIFLLSFMMDPPEEDSEDKELILGQIYSIINELPSLICSIHYNEMKDMISETKLSDLLQKIAGVEDEVRKLYTITPRSSQFKSPTTNSMGFLDSILQKLTKLLEEEVNFIGRVKHGIQTVWEELASLRPFMQHITDIQNEQEELKDLWTRIVGVVYYASYVTKLCPPKSLPIWYGIICLPSVIEEIKVIKNEVREVNDSQMCKSKMPSIEMESRNTIPRTSTSKVEGGFIGFREDTESIIDGLVAGGKYLRIISISGMPGQGKTTLAKRIYNDPRIQYHFHKTVWCYVSKECKIRDLMIGIVHDVRKTVVEDISKLGFEDLADVSMTNVEDISKLGIEDLADIRKTNVEDISKLGIEDLANIRKTNVEDISKLGIEDLADILRKSLKGKRYLIVMDDIWDDGVWCEVQSSFPDDKNGSRILFTSRNCNLISQDQLNFISYPLRSFSDEESWDLMTEKLNRLGTDFEVIGKEIAKSCKGLPLAVALVASLLGKTEQKLELWKQVAENLKTHLDSEGCMHIIELSYKYLPDHLKSCFLYFGAFQRGENIRARRLKLLWIAEGFIKGNEMQCSEDLAEKCLDDLVSQSLIVVAERSLIGGIKRCNVHDLLYDLCLGKIVQDNFLHWLDCSTIHNECRSIPQKYGHHRLCIGESDPLMEARPICRRKELPTSPVESLLWSDRRLDILSFDFLKSFKVLSVLDLEEVYLEGDVFPEVILCNIHLKYLALCGSFKNIPPSIAELWNLETLILTDGFLVSLIPHTMWRMKSLRHVIIDGGYVSLKDFEGNESYVAALDNNIETLGGRRLEIDDQRTVEFLGRMTRLRKLKCTFKRGNILFSVFGFLENLEQLRISGNIDLDSETCSSFPQNKNLRKLTLIGWSVESWSAMSTIGKHLPNLEVLKLEWVKCKESSRWDLEDVFSKLRYLKLKRLDDLEEINVSVDCDNPFPCLEVLVVEECPSLKEIPSEIGDIGSLNTIKMSDCSRKASESVMQILEQQRDLGNHSLRVFVTDMLARGRYDDDEGPEEEESEEEESEGKAEAIVEDESVDDEETEEEVESNLKKTLETLVGHRRNRSI